MMKPILRYPLSLWQKLLERRFRAQSSCGTVLMFHDVYEEGASPREAGIAISAENFVSLLDALTKEHTVISLKSYDDILAMRTGDVVITFDDMFRSAYRNAVPALRERGIPYTVFIATGLLGQPGYITEDDLKELQADPLCTVAAHSVSHRMFRFSPELLAEEARQSAARLGANLFAYPYGSVYACSRRNQRDIEASGLFSCAFSTLNADLTAESKKLRFFLPRRNVDDAGYLAWKAADVSFKKGD